MHHRIFSRWCASPTQNVKLIFRPTQFENSIESLGCRFTGSEKLLFLAEQNCSQSSERRPFPNHPVEGKRPKMLCEKILPGRKLDPIKEFTLTQMNAFDRARAYVAKMPPAISGQGGHGQTFSVACVLLWGYALAEGEALGLFREYNNRCQPPWSDRELHHKLRSAGSAYHRQPYGHLLGNNSKARTFRNRPMQVVKCDPVTHSQKFLNGFSCCEDDLSAASPVRVAKEWQNHAILLVESLFQAGEKVNFVTTYKIALNRKAEPIGCGRTCERNTLLATWRRNGISGSAAGGWLRMNPVDGLGIGNANVAAYRFVLVEFDHIPLELQLSILAKFPMPIAAIITSGGRSVHAWVKINASNLADYEAQARKILDVLRCFDVDQNNKNPSRLSRLPGVTRRLNATGDGRQRLLYLNPTPKLGAIL
jgi:hypothetical protein